MTAPSVYHTLEKYSDSLKISCYLSKLNTKFKSFTYTCFLIHLPHFWNIWAVLHHVPLRNRKWLQYVFWKMISEKAMAPHSNTLAWKILWTEEPGELQSMGSLRVGHDWATSLSLFTFMQWRRKWQPTPVFLPGESQEEGGAWWAAVYGVAQSRTRLKRFSSSSSSMQIYFRVSRAFKTNSDSSPIPFWRYTHRHMWFSHWQQSLNLVRHRFFWASEWGKCSFTISRKEHKAK